jgi:hypothetical protein
MGEINKTLNGFSKTLKADVTKLLSKPADPPAADPQADPPADPTPGAPKVDPAITAQLATLTRTVTDLKKQNETLASERESEKKSRLETERVTSIRNVLNSIEFKDPAAREMFFKAISGDVKYDDEGRLVAEGESGVLPMADYIKTQADANQYLLAPKGGGGAGAVPGNKRPNGAGGPVKMSDLTPEKIAAMKPEEYTAAMSQILAGNVS